MVPGRKHAAVKPLKKPKKNGKAEPQKNVQLY